MAGILFLLHNLPSLKVMAIVRTRLKICFQHTERERFAKSEWSCKKIYLTASFQKIFYHSNLYRLFPCSFQFQSAMVFSISTPHLSSIATTSIPIPNDKSNKTVLRYITSTSIIITGFFFTSNSNAIWLALP